VSLPFSIMPDLTVRRNRVRRCTKLHATTEEADAATPTKEKKIKKKAKDSLEVVVIGLSHHNAKVEVREKLAIPEDQWNEAATVIIHNEPYRLQMKHFTMTTFSLMAQHFPFIRAFATTSLYLKRPFYRHAIVSRSTCLGRTSTSASETL
jgi:hypothetical protein